MDAAAAAAAAAAAPPPAAPAAPPTSGRFRIVTLALARCSIGAPSLPGCAVESYPLVGYAAYPTPLPEYPATHGRKDKDVPPWVQRIAWSPWRWGCGVGACTGGSCLGVDGCVEVNSWIFFTHACRAWWICKSTPFPLL